MRTHGSARRSPAIRSRRRVSSFSRASSALHSASHSSLDTTRWLSVLVWEMSVMAAICAFTARLLLDTIDGRWRLETHSAGHRDGGSDKCRDSHGLTNHDCGAALAAGELLGVLKRVACVTTRLAWLDAERT